MEGKTLDKKTRNLILFLFLIGVFMGSLDTGIIGPVLPSINRASTWQVGNQAGYLHFL